MNDIQKDVVDTPNSISNDPSKLSTLHDQTSSATVGGITTPPGALEELRKSITLVVNEGFDKDAFLNEIMNPDLKGLTCVFAHLNTYEGRESLLQSNKGIDVAYDLLRRNPEGKVLLFSPINFDQIKLLSEKMKSGNHSEMLTIMSSNKNFRFLEMPFTAEKLNSCFEPDVNGIKELQESIKFDGKDNLELLKSQVENPALRNCHIIYDHLKECNGKLYNGVHGGMDLAYEILRDNTEEKVILGGWFSIEDLLDENKRNKIGMDSHYDKLLVLLANKNFRYVQLPPDYETLNNCFDNEEKQINQQEVFEAERKIAKNAISMIRHSLELYKVKDPYHPANSNEQGYVDHAFELTQKYFPGLDTIEKMLDYVMNVNIEIPEVMKGERIEGVYVDVDGTLIDYVPIGSPLEGTQQLRQPVVELLKKYESEGKKIIVRTGGNVEMKEEYLRGLGITWPVVSKYDYAGATAEIVVDDTDKSAFILQSKIMPETYVDTRNMK